MKIFSSYYNFIKKLYEKEESGLALALFRIAYGLVVFAEVSQIFYFRHLIFDPIPYAEGVKKYIYFWAYKNNIDLTNSTFKVKYKYNEVPYKWEKDLLKNALNKPWKEAGKLGWKNGKFYSDIIDIENQKKGNE